jgi:hypothetical protein
MGYYGVEILIGVIEGFEIVWTSLFCRVNIPGIAAYLGTAETRCRDVPILVRAILRARY